MRPRLPDDRRKPQLTRFYSGPADKDFYTVDLERVLDNRRSAARFEDVIEIKMLLDGLTGRQTEIARNTPVSGPAVVPGARPACSISDVTCSF